MRSFVLDCVRRPEGLVAARGWTGLLQTDIVQPCSQTLLWIDISFLFGWRGSSSLPVSCFLSAPHAVGHFRGECMCSVGATVTEIVVWPMSPSQGRCAHAICHLCDPGTFSYFYGPSVMLSVTIVLL